MLLPGWRPTMGPGTKNQGLPSGPGIQGQGPVNRTKSAGKSGRTVGRTDGRSVGRSDGYTDGRTVSRAG